MFFEGFAAMLSMKKTTGAGVLLSIGGSVLLAVAASLARGSAGAGAAFVSLILAPGYLGYACLRETFVGPLNVHLDVGEWLLGGFLLNTVAWIVICLGARWAVAKRAAGRAGQ
jgi:hypothetical protein